MRLHLDTSFIIDWHRGDSRIVQLRDEILAGSHAVSLDPIIEVEFFAAPNVGLEKEALFRSVEIIAERVEITSATARLAATWLGELQLHDRRRNFNDAFAAAAAVNGATLVTADKQISRRYPVALLQY